MKKSKWRKNLYTIIFEAETPKGKLFDVVLIILVILSVFAVVIETVDSIHHDFQKLLFGAEWVFTVLFTIEYILRLLCVKKPMKYATSFFGLVDLFSIVPTYLSLFIPGTQGLMVIRALRLLRVFRVLKLTRFTSASNFLFIALRQARHKIIVFLGFVITSVCIIGALMYIVEGDANGFTSIPRSIYWAIVTMTTVGYGDISPSTPLGQFIASVVMIAGYGILAVPTGIVSAEMAQLTQKKDNTRTCRHCTKEGHDLEALYCNSCGFALEN